MTIHGRSFSIVGVTDTADPDQMEMAFVPYTALQDALGIAYLHTITIEAAQAGEASRIAAETATLLRARHASHIDAAVEKLRRAGVTGNQMPVSGVGGAPDDFTVKTQSSQALTKGCARRSRRSSGEHAEAGRGNLEEMNATPSASTTMTALLAGIADRWSSAASDHEHQLVAGKSGRAKSASGAQWARAS